MVFKIFITLIRDPLVIRKMGLFYKFFKAFVFLLKHYYIVCVYWLSIVKYCIYFVSL